MAKALGMIETRGLIASIEAADAMVKSADVRLISQEKVDAALVTILIEGDVGAVQAALEAGKAAAQRIGELVACHIIPRPDDEVHTILKKQEDPPEAKKSIEVPAVSPQNTVLEKVELDTVLDNEQTEEPDGDGEGGPPRGGRKKKQ
jgi:ethanolamine utilization protein EutM